MRFLAFVKSRQAAPGNVPGNLAPAPQAGDSYIYRLLKETKAPPDQDRARICGKLEALLRLEPGEPARLYSDD